MVAPMVATYDYRPYGNPLEAEMTSDAIAVEVPPDMFARFNLSDGRGGSAEEQYILRSIELRAPGRLPEGSMQVLSHVLELVLLHEDMGRPGVWASVVLPLAVAIDPATDILASLLAGSELPEREGQREPVLMRASQPLELSKAFEGAAFLTYWAELPSRCEFASALPARQLLRNNTLDMSQSTFARALRALRAVPSASPLRPPKDAWLMSTCVAQASGEVASAVANASAPASASVAANASNDAGAVAFVAASARTIAGDCVPMEAEDLSQPLLEAQTLQAQALTNLRTRKVEMDHALLELGNVSQASYNLAVNARDNLRDAEAELDAATASVTRFEGWIAQAQVAKWTSTPPSVNDSAASTPPPSGAALLAAVLAKQAEVHAHGAGGASGATGPAQGDCLALGLSPAAISSGAAAAAAGAATPEPIGFVQAEGAAEAGPEPHIFNTGEYVRIVAPPPRPGGEPLLGSLVVGGQRRSIAFADLHVPGEHAVDSVTAAAELQLVHLPEHGGGPAIAVALLLEVSANATPSAGLGALLSSLPAPRKRSPVPARTAAAALAQAHAAVASGAAARYFRYDGTLTRSPCRVAEWFVLEERGTIAAEQLAALRAALPAAGSATAPTHGPHGAVVRGLQLLGEATSAQGKTPGPRRSPAAAIPASLLLSASRRAASGAAAPAASVVAAAPTAAVAPGVALLAAVAPVVVASNAVAPIAAAAAPALRSRGGRLASLLGRLAHPAAQTAAAALAA